NRELVARVRALLRRISRNESKAVNLEVDGLVMNLEARTVAIKGKELKLRPKEFDLLYMFLLKPNIVLSREYILENVFDYNIGVTTRTIDTHIKNLRQALGSWGDKINTIFGRGFKFVPDVKKR
ncbi:MAG: response regulator transcription factor, partial [Elusimicrobia bacterium]|nr:response regulator transcription factor [Elusimicrobiota bacterium]